MRLFIYHHATLRITLTQRSGEPLRKLWRRGLVTLRELAENVNPEIPEVMARGRYRPEVTIGDWWLTTLDRTLQPRWSVDAKGLP